MANPTTESDNIQQATGRKDQRSRQIMAHARSVIPGGVNSPVRAFKGVGGEAVVMQSASGAWLTDVDGNRYIDYVGSWGPMILGHNHPEVIAAIQEQLALGMSFGTPTEREGLIAEKLTELVPSLESVRLVSSGTEATMSAIRLARGATGRNLVVKFEGCYHGHVDSLLVKAGSGLLTLGNPDSAGVPAEFAAHTAILPYNDLEACEAFFAERGAEVAALIVEPVAGNMGCIPPAAGFLQGLRTLCTKHSALLIFDEVMTGFRVGPAGAQGVYGITPDLTTLGKVIGGGMPVGAFGGRREIMENLAPQGAVYQAGTLSGNPVATAAGLATLEILSRDEACYRDLHKRTDALVAGFKQLAASHSLPTVTNNVCGMFSLFFTEQSDVSNFDQVMGCDKERFSKFFHALLDQGVYLAPSAFEAGFVSIAHDDDIISRTLEGMDEAMKSAA